ncbi:hypothetical protein PCANC_04570 [Puccinia coronata f. sp. avenae]|uniref:Uncharacterized protein n=1 Tax=Puccinia coronata f. sp. avenae TaxID=200324 RepID=A0A2N5VQZ4_9BASI|nr:hypothetical protein PCASD_00023 [Puccinia coronata f. sp. avenae]PLW55712.1 hypothetical protein PCANC_04570 [Puccinia coronata f. sp. avenae]
MPSGMTKPDGETGAQTPAPGGMGKSKIASMLSGKGVEGGGSIGSGKPDIKAIIAKLKSKTGDVTKRANEPTGNLIWKRDDAPIKVKGAENGKVTPLAPTPKEADSRAPVNHPITNKKIDTNVLKKSSNKERRQELGGGKYDIKSLLSKLKGKTSADLSKRSENSIRNTIWKREDAPDPKPVSKTPAKPTPATKEPTTSDKKADSPDTKEADKSSPEEPKPKQEGERKSLKDRIKGLVAKLKSKAEVSKAATTTAPAE